MAEFSKAFRAARASGKKTFQWNGKSYTTKLKPKSDPNKSPSSHSATSGPPSDKLQKAVDSASAKGKPAVAAAPKPQQGPQPAKPVGIARAGSPIARAAAKLANVPAKAPMKTPAEAAKTMGDAGAPLTAAQKASVSQATAKAPAKPAGDQQGPKPEGVWYAKKGSAISTAAARRANAPKVRAALSAKK
jgi:hypothetical protein